MPGRDGTGPLGLGPMGRGLGGCRALFGPRAGAGGQTWRHRGPGAVQPENFYNPAMLEEYAAFFEEQALACREMATRLKTHATAD